VLKTPKRQPAALNSSRHVTIGGCGTERLVSWIIVVSLEMSALKELFKAKELWPLLVVYFIAIAAVVILGVDVATSSGGSGTIVSVNTVAHSGNLTSFAGAVSTPNGDFDYTMSCIQLHVGDQVHYEHDFLEGFQLVGALPDNCTTT